MKGILVLLGVVLLQFQFGSALKCHQCNSKDQDHCEDLVDDRYLTECGNDGEMKDSANFVVCRKLDQWVDFEVLGQTPFKRVLRQCGKTKDQKVCVYKAGLGARVNICECTDNGCNTGNTIVLQAAAILTAAIAFFYTTKL